MAIIRLEQKHTKRLMKMSLFYKGKKENKDIARLSCLYLSVFSYLDDVNLFFSVSRYELLDCYKCG